jgi:hypothetical protein
VEKNAEVPLGFPFLGSNDGSNRGARAIPARGRPAARPHTPYPKTCLS